ncbi:MAG: hypothetical protein H6704_26505 [Myxococcales bacterium]|nr:hypothetical protein [Myxococcales bacterium]
MLADLWREAGGAPPTPAEAQALAALAEGNPLALDLLAAQGRAATLEEVHRRAERAGRAREGAADATSPELARAIRSALSPLGRDRRPRLLLTVAALCPGGRGTADPEPPRGAPPDPPRRPAGADARRLARARTATGWWCRRRWRASRCGRRKPSALASGGPAGARAALGACVASWTELEGRALDRADLLAVHRLLRQRRGTTPGPWDVAQAGVALLRGRAPLLARATLRAALGDDAPLVRLDAARALVGLAMDLDEAAEAEQVAEVLGALAGEVGDPLSGLVAALRAHRARALEAADARALQTAWAAARALAAHDAGVLWRTTADALHAAAVRRGALVGAGRGARARAWAAPLRRALSPEAQWRWIARPWG